MDALSDTRSIIRSQPNTAASAADIRSLSVQACRSLSVAAEAELATTCGERSEDYTNWSPPCSRRVMYVLLNAADACQHAVCISLVTSVSHFTVLSVWWQRDDKYYFSLP